MKKPITRGKMLRGALPGRAAVAMFGLCLATISGLTSSCNTRGYNQKGDESEGLAKKGKEPSMEEAAELSASRDDSVPLKEISALTRWPDPSGKMKDRAVALSDRDHSVMVFDLDAPGSGREAQRIDLAPALRAFGDVAGSDSQWEGMTSDGAGNLYVMTENPGTIHVFSPDLKKVLNRIDLVVPRSHDLASSWEKDSNSRGEGLVLLSNGHILVMKEKNPSALVEFGPEGETPIGFSESTRRTVADKFTLPKKERTQFVPLKAWPLASSAEELLNDVSEISLGADGKLYLLSDESRRIARLEDDLRPDEGKARIEAHWKLPAQVSKPEGLVIREDMSPVVAIDVKSDGEPNVFFFPKLR